MPEARQNLSQSLIGFVKAGIGGFHTAVKQLAGKACNGVIIRRWGFPWEPLEKAYFGKEGGSIREKETGKEPVYVLFTCNQWKEYSSMRIAGATTRQEVLYAMIASRIKAGEMLYRSENPGESWEQFRRDYAEGNVMLEFLTYGYVEEYTDKYFSDPELTAEFPNILPLWESLEKERVFESLRPLRLQERCMVFSIAELRSEAGYQMIYLPGWGTEETLRQSAEYREYTAQDDVLDIHVDVGTYKIGRGDEVLADEQQTALIQRYFDRIPKLHEADLCASDCYTLYFDRFAEDETEVAEP